MPKFMVSGIVNATVYLGTFEAATEEAALQMAMDDPEADWLPSLCHQCAGEIELGDIYETVVDPAE